MKRDMELVREILLFMESLGPGEEREVTFEGYTEEQVDFHNRLMYEAGLIAAIEAGTRGNPDRVIPQRITWEGYEFLDAARSPEVWSKATKQVTSTVGTVSLSVLTAVLIEVAKEKLGLR